jgi:hypothetical protein
LTGFDSLASKNHRYKILKDAHARTCGLTAEGNCSSDTVRLVPHVRRGVLVALVPIATLALELRPSTCRRGALVALVPIATLALELTPSTCRRVTNSYKFHPEGQFRTCVPFSCLAAIQVRIAVPHVRRATYRSF